MHAGLCLATPATHFFFKYIFLKHTFFCSAYPVQTKLFCIYIYLSSMYFYLKSQKQFSILLHCCILGTFMYNGNPFTRTILLPLMYRVYLQHINTTITGEKKWKRDKNKTIKILKRILLPIPMVANGVRCQQPMLPKFLVEW